MIQMMVSVRKKYKLGYYLFIVIKELNGKYGDFFNKVSVIIILSENI